MNQSVLEIKDLIKHFHSRSGLVKAVNGVNLEVYSGEIFGFLGPNGAGKPPPFAF